MTQRAGWRGPSTIMPQMQQARRSRQGGRLEATTAPGRLSVEPEAAAPVNTRFQPCAAPGGRPGSKRNGPGPGRHFTSSPVRDCLSRVCSVKWVLGEVVLGEQLANALARVGAVVAAAAGPDHNLADDEQAG